MSTYMPMYCFFVMHAVCISTHSPWIGTVEEWAMPCNIFASSRSTSWPTKFHYSTHPNSIKNLSSGLYLFNLQWQTWLSTKGTGSTYFLAQVQSCLWKNSDQTTIHNKKEGKFGMWNLEMNVLNQLFPCFLFLMGEWMDTNQTSSTVTGKTWKKI